MMHELAIFSEFSRNIRLLQDLGYNFLSYDQEVSEIQRGIDLYLTRTEAGSEHRVAKGYCINTKQEGEWVKLYFNDSNQIYLLKIGGLPVGDDRIVGAFDKCAEKIKDIIEGRKLVKDLAFVILHSIRSHFKKAASPQTRKKKKEMDLGEVVVTCIDYATMGRDNDISINDFLISFKTSPIEVRVNFYGKYDETNPRITLKDNFNPLGERRIIPRTEYTSYGPGEEKEIAKIFLLFAKALPSLKEFIFERRDSMPSIFREVFNDRSLTLQDESRERRLIDLVKFSIKKGIVSLGREQGDFSITRALIPTRSSAEAVKLKSGWFFCINIREKEHYLELHLGDDNEVAMLEINRRILTDPSRIAEEVSSCYDKICQKIRELSVNQAIVKSLHEYVDDLDGLSMIKIGQSVPEYLNDAGLIKEDCFKDIMNFLPKMNEYNKNRFGIFNCENKGIFVNLGDGKEKYYIRSDNEYYVRSDEEYYISSDEEDKEYNEGSFEKIASEDKKDLNKLVIITYLKSLNRLDLEFEEFIAPAPRGAGAGAGAGAEETPSAVIERPALEYSGGAESEVVR